MRERQDKPRRTRVEHGGFEMSAKHNFNSSISVVGIKEPKVQQAILRLLENSLSLKESFDRKIRDLRVENKQLKQMIAQMGG